MHIGITGPTYLPSIKINYSGDRNIWPRGMGGSPVNNEINALLELGYKVSVFSLSPEIEPGNSFEWIDGNLSIFMGPYRKKARSRCLDLFYKERKFLKEKILEIKPDVIHAHWQYEWGWAAINSGIPTLLTCHDAPIKILQNKFDLYRVCRLIMAFIVLRKAKYITAVSPDTKKGLKIFTKKTITVIPNFASDNTFTFNQTRKINNSLKVVMINNSFYGPKNVKLGVQAFNRLKTTLPNIELHLYGKHHGKNEDAEQWCQNNSVLGNVFFHGELPYETLMLELSKNDILIHTSLEESFGMILIEAMAMGIPVVAGINSGGVPWVLKEGGGELVDIKSEDAIIQGIEKVVADYNNYSKQAHLVASNRFSKKNVVDLYLNKLKNII
ncbi:MAG: glycosyltransferase family 4 protein [Burkholderiales bacterium]|nr:glycosyltransferase family 4 protein [Bacteroidia bacterium]